MNMAEKDPAQAMTSSRVAAGALFVDEHERVLCVHPSYKTSWDIPGGYVETGESPRDACIREVREELGISPPFGAMLIVDWAPHPREGDKLLFIFDGGTLAQEQRDTMRPDGDEVTEYAFLDLVDVDERMVARLARRIRAAAQARSNGGPLYLEHGEALPN